MCRIFDHWSIGIVTRQRSEFLYSGFMPPVGPSLKMLREATVPRLSIRSAAEKLDMGYSSYNFYENPNTYKKPHLPIDFARKVAALFSQYGVDPADVMKLAGLRDSEAEPEAREIEAQRPTIQFVSFPVALPSEVALRDMFESLLTLVPEGATRAETAQILARRLPAGFAGIGPFTVDQASAAYDAKLDGAAAGAGKGSVERR